jgi:hypothetical protein
MIAECEREAVRSDAFDLTAYRAFLRAKVPATFEHGIDVPESEFNPLLKPHQVAIARWMVRGGRRACFAAFGLGKTVIQLEACRVAREHHGGLALITLPLGVRQEFARDARMLGIQTRFIRRIEEVDREDVIYLTNYETVREGKLDPRQFSVTSLDEAAILRSFGGTKTFRQFMRLFADDDMSTSGFGRGIPYRFIATATPSPNEYIELLAYAAYLGVADVGQMKTRFFRRDSTKADHLMLRPHKEKEFWLWVASWALFCTKPSDLGPEYSDEGYILPPMEVCWHEIPTDHAKAGADRNGQVRMFRDSAIGVQSAAREKRDSLEQRVAAMVELVEADDRPDRRQWVVWCDLNAEQEAASRALKGAGLTVSSIYGAQDLDVREELMDAWRGRRTDVLLSKPVMLGSGVNLQQCNRAIFLGIGFKFADFIQAVHRVYRFLQCRPVRIDLIYTEAERGIRQILESKWERHKEMVQTMTDLIREHGLAQVSLAAALTRKLGTERVEVSGQSYTVVNNDAIEETARMESDSVDLIVTSIPFSTQYEYSPSYNDLGHTDDDDHFFEHLGFLTPQLLRVLRPGRVAAVHVKDRIVPGGINGYGFQTVSPFSDMTVAHFRRHGWAFLARKTIVTDVVRENNQTYRLGWTEQCKDGSRMGAGMPEYLLLFRKPPTDRSNGYADLPVVKDKASYSRSRWQIDAHGFMRSSGDRLLRPEELRALSHQQIFQLFRKYGLENVYDFEFHVRLGEELERMGRLPVTFMLLQPPSWHPDVWTDIARMRSLNMLQERKGQEQHLCPLPFDIVDRAIEQFSMPGETVYDPFGGLQTVPYCAIRKGRRGIGVELSPTYFTDGASYCEAAEREMAMPTLFDLPEAPDGLDVEAAS